MRAAYEAFGWLAAALFCVHAADQVAEPKGKPTPLCLVFGSYMDAPGAAGAWLGGWDGCSWEYVNSWPSINTPFERMYAFELGRMALRVWKEARLLPKSAEEVRAQIEAMAKKRGIA